MGWLNPTSQVVNAVLTKKGRQLLANNSPDFNIVKFALGDQEIDYSLWNSNHASGSDYYGSVIEQQPVFEAMPDETTTMLSKLISLPRGITSMPYVVVAPLTMILTLGQDGIIKPSTLNGASGYDDKNAGYTCILHNQAIAKLETTSKAPSAVPITTLPSDILDDATAINSTWVTGLEFKVTAKDVSTISGELRQCLVTVFGNETGASATLTLTVTPPVSRLVTV